jgi:precorrin-6B methylase 2
LNWEPFEEEDGMWVPFKPDSSDDRSLAPLVNTPLIRAREMIDIGCIGESDIVVDLGCGGGEILCEIARLSGAKKCIGMEIDKNLIRKAELLVQSKGLEETVSIIEQNIVTADLSMATVLVIFLTPWAMELLSAQLERAICQGTRVVSYWWPAMALQKHYLRQVGPNKNIYLYGKDSAAN